MVHFPSNNRKKYVTYRKEGEKNRLRIGHSLLPCRYFNFFLNSSPLCTNPYEESIYEFNHFIFNCPSLLPNRQLLFSFLSSLGYIIPDSNFSSTPAPFLLLLYLSLISSIPPTSLFNCIHKYFYLFFLFFYLYFYLNSMYN
jgi:hypothetical protein